MTMVNALQQLITKALQLGQDKYFNNHGFHTNFLVEVSHVFFQIILEVLKNQNKFAVGVNDFSEMYDIDMIEFLKDGDLSYGGRGNTFLFAFKSNFFEGEYFVCLLI
jgi:hypothetical protein